VVIIESCFIYMTDAALEKCKRSGYYIDVVIDSKRYRGSTPRPPKRWGSQIAVPIERIAF
jgi:hypothetical protein